MAPLPGMPSPAAMADKLFGFSDPNENKKWSTQFDEFRDTAKERERTGFVDSVQLASQLDVGAVSHLKSIGEDLGAELGEATGLFPGHMQPVAKEPDAEPEVEKSPEDEFSEQLVNRITSKFKSPEESASKGPRLLGDSFGR